jgi:hypothetical protein
MPETAMHENYFVPTGEDNIGLSRKFLTVDAKAITVLVEHGAKQNFWLSVLATNLAHVLAAALRIEFIHTC